jgi:hypothetical protein
MDSVYDPCPCNSGKKLKFCCHNTSDLTKFPVIGCFIGKNWQDAGMSNVIVARKAFDGSIIAGVYLVDIWCLGVKDAYSRKKLDSDDLRYLCNTIAQASDGVMEISYEDARSIILGSVNYAAKIGIQPHPDWNSNSNMVEPARAFEDKFEFGKDGKPYYVAGPYDKNVAKKYIEKVAAAGGDYTAPLEMMYGKKNDLLDDYGL